MPPKKKQKTGAEKVQTYASSLINTSDIWADKDYTYKDQKAKFKRHLTDRAKQTQKNALTVPPLNTGVPTKLFTVGLPFIDFLKLWATNPSCQKVLTVEMEIEVNRAYRDRDIAEKTKFFGSQMQWNSWSAMLMLQKCYPERMEKCAGFITCLIHMIRHTLHTEYPPGRSISDVSAFIMAMMSFLNSMYVAMYTTHFVNLHPSPANEFKGKILNAIRKQDNYRGVKWTWWIDTFKSNEKKMYTHLLVDGKLQTSKHAENLKKKRSDERQATGLSRPTEVHEVDFLRGVKKLMGLVFGPDLDSSIVFDDKFTIENDKHCAACLCLLQLLCGSRSRGVIGVNWFGPIPTSPEEEIQNAENGTRQSMMDSFSGYDYIIQVMRITKEKKKDVRDYNLLVKKAKLEKKDIDSVELPSSDTTEVHKVITKPILYMYLERKYFDREWVKDPVVVDAKTGVDIFLELMRKTRMFVQKTSPVEVKWASTKDRKLDTSIPGFTDDEAYNRGRKITFNWNAKMNRVLKGYAKEPGVFPFIKEGQGTHMLRRLYVNRGYYHFSSNRVKETAFTRMTLGHESFQVSLFYTSLMFIPSVTIDGSADTIAKRFQEKVAKLEADIEAMKERLDGHVGKDEVEFRDRRGDMVKIERLPRAPRGTSMDGHIQRTFDAIEKLRAAHVDVNWSRLERIGVQRSVPLRNMVRESQRYESIH